MTQSELEVANEKFKKLLKIFSVASYLTFIPECRWKILNYLKIALLPSLEVLSVILSVHQTISLIGKSYDVVGFLYLIMFSCGYYQTFCKFLISAIIFKDELDKLVEYFEQLTYNDRSIMARIRQVVLSKNLQLTYKIAIFFIFGVSVSLVTYTIFAIHHSNYTSVLFFNFPWVHKGSILHIPLNLLLQIVILCYTVFYMISIDILLLYIVQFFYSEFESVSRLISDLNTEGILTDKQCDRIIFTAYKCHLKAKEMLKVLQAITWNIYFIQFCTSCVYVCIVIFMVRMSTSNIAFYLIPPAIIGQMFLVCYIGQIVKNGGEEVPQSMIMANWYQMNLRNQKHFLMLLHFIQKPTSIRTFGFNEISVSTFLQLMKATASYCAFLYTFFSSEAY